MGSDTAKVRRRLQSTNTYAHATFLRDTKVWRGWRGRARWSVRHFPEKRFLKHDGAAGGDPLTLAPQPRTGE